MKKTFVKFCVLQGAYWSFQAAVPGYITAYMLSKGMPASTLGILLSANLLCAFLGALYWGRWVDRKHASRRFFLLANVAALGLGLLSFLFAGNSAALFVIYPLFGFMNGPIATALDTWIIASFPDRPGAGPRARSFATLSYAIVMLVTGQLVTRVGYHVMLVATVLFLGVSIAVALVQPEAMRTTEAAERPVQASPKQLLSVRRYILLVATMFFTGMAIAPINNMKVLVFESVGGDVSFLGWDSFIGCMVQVPFLLFAGKLRRIRTERRLILGAVAALLYAGIVAAARFPVMVIVGTVMNNVSFGVLYPAMREMTEASVDSSLRNTAHSIIDVAYGSLSGMIATAWSGSVMQYAGSAVMGSVCVGIELVSIALCILLILRSSVRRCAPSKKRIAVG